MGNAPEPDWYTDPTGIHHHRYWDGERWTARVADRFGATSAHHLQDPYGPPGSAASPPAPAPPPPSQAEVPEPAEPIEPDVAAFAAEISDDYTPKRKRAGRGLLRRKRAEREPTVAVEQPVDLGVTTEAEMHIEPGEHVDDALALAAQTLQIATEEAGFSWRDSEMTIDDAINALPVDIADNTVNLMHRLFTTAGDDENAAWTEAKLGEIKLLKRSYRRLYELVAGTPRDELLARARAFGVPDDLTEDFVAGILHSEIPTVAELLSARLPIEDPVRSRCDVAGQ